MHLLKLNFICPTLGVHFTFQSDGFFAAKAWFIQPWDLKDAECGLPGG